VRWETNSGRVLRQARLVGNCPAIIRAAALSGDGKTLALTGQELAPAAERRALERRLEGEEDVRATVYLYDADSGRPLRRWRGHRGPVLRLAFSPNGKLLASAGRDGTVLVWGVDGGLGPGQKPAAAPRPAPEALWADLAGADAARAYRVRNALVADAARAVPLLSSRLRPASGPPPQRMRRLAEELGSDRWEARERAERELIRWGARAGPALRRLLGGKPSLEASAGPRRSCCGWRGES
jgi:hypothetical protein